MRALAAALIVVATTAAAPAPQSLASGEPAAPQLPEIGRTRANTPACAAMRDLVIPSFAAAQRADARFTETRKRLPQYVAIAEEPGNAKRQNGARDAALLKLDADASALLEDALTIKKALADQRLEPGSTDPLVATERAQLEALYDAQRARADVLMQFVQREHASNAPNGMGDNDGIASRIAPASQRALDAPPATHASKLTAPPGMPLMSGIPAADAQSLTDWSTGIAVAVRAKENAVAKAFLPIAKACP